MAMVVGVPQQNAMVPPPTTKSEDEPEVGGCDCGPPMAIGAFICCAWNPIMYCQCCLQVNQNEHKAVLYYGKYTGTMREPGIYCMNPCGRDLRVVSSKYATLELKDVKVLDARGSPVVVSGVVTYTVISAKKACVDVEDVASFVQQQATTVMKQVASRYPYSAAPGQPSLQTEGPHIREELVQVTQLKVAVAGAHISNFEMVDLAYAPEIAQVMLVKQQAEALVEARRLIVSAAVDMAHHAVEQLDSKGVKLSQSARENVTSNLLSVICSHSPASPTIPLK